MNTNNEQNIREILQATCRPIAASSQFKIRVLKRLGEMMRTPVRQLPPPLWRQPKLLISVAVAIVLAVIAYGLWLPQIVVQSMTLP